MTRRGVALIVVALVIGWYVVGAYLWPLLRCRSEQIVTPWYGYTRCR